ncbi:MAG TPA: IPT/TIG domain-containing protein [Vicinamibacteria bacterium]
MPPREPARAARPPARARGGTTRVVAIAAAGLAVVAVAAFVLSGLLGAPSIRGIDPGRVRVGDAITITGRNFASDAGRNLVHFEGTRPGRVLQASSGRLQVEVPEIPAAPGRPNRVPVTVTVNGRRSDPMDIAVYLAPRVHGLAPSVAMPGEEVVLAGTGWSTGATVAFGGRPAEVLETTATAIRVRVPELEGPPGTSAPVVVTMAGETSNPAPFLLGHLPLLLSLEPRAAAPGDVIVMSGRGFQTHAPSNDVRVGGTRALVVAANDAEIRVLVPWVPPGSEVPVDVKVPGSDFVGQATLAINPAADPAEFRFTAEPFADQPDHDHAVLSTAIGPAFVVSAAGGRTAAVRAAEAVRRLNDAAAALKASLAQDVEMRGLDVGSPALVLTGTGETLLDITDEDAAAYREDWTNLRGRGGAVTRARLAVWWGAVARDLVRLLVRWEAPQHAAALAAEGRVLGELHAAARKTNRLGIPRAVVDRAAPALRNGMRTMALRVPAAVVAPVDAGPAGARPTPAVEAPAAGTAGQLEGDWTGRESEGGEPRHVNVTFTRDGGSLSYQRALSLTLPLMGVEIDRRGNVRYSMQTARGARYYAGRWDGEKIEGRIFSDPERQDAIGTFTLERVR